MKSFILTGLMWLGLVGGQMAQAAPEDEPTNLAIDPVTGILSGDFRLCFNNYMTHLFLSGGVDAGLFEVRAHGYYFNGRCVTNTLPSTFRETRDWIGGSDGRGTMWGLGMFDIRGVRLTPYAQNDPVPLSSPRVITGKRNMHIELRLESGVYRFVSLVYIP